MRQCWDSLEATAKNKKQVARGIMKEGGELGACIGPLGVLEMQKQSFDMLARSELDKKELSGIPAWHSK